MHVSPVSFPSTNPIGFAPANVPPFEDLLQGFRAVLEGGRALGPTAINHRPLPADLRLSNPMFPPPAAPGSLLPAQPRSAQSLPQPLQDGPEAQEARPAPVPEPPPEADSRAADLKAAVARAAASGPGPLDDPSTPGGMANGFTASLLARGFVKFEPALGQDPPNLEQRSPDVQGALQKIDRIAQISLSLNHSGDAQTPGGPRTARQTRQAVFQLAEADRT
jgi:hypothetical protein